MPMDFDQVPHLITADTGPLHYLERHIVENHLKIEGWLREQWQQFPPPLHSSVDLRNAAFKLAPVDTNLFPAGFNNLNRDFIPLCIQATQSTLQQRYPHLSKILLVSESHTRNPNYYLSLATLHEIISKAGYEVRIGTLRDVLTTAETIALENGQSIVVEPIQRQNNTLHLENFVPELIWLNNDLAEGIPKILENLDQPVTPPLKLGWAHRYKSNHFKYYEAICNEFSELIQMDPWLINPAFRHCGEINFLKREGTECLTKNADLLFKTIQRKYNEYRIDQKPFLVIKADTGTYGMGVMTIQSTEELLSLNRKQRTHMSHSKGRQAINRVIMQEGVYTFETWDQAIAEPVVYMLGAHVVGGFYRVHKNRGITENLNAPGMQFEPLAFAEPCNNPDPCCDTPSGTHRFYAYGVVARLALLAAAREVYYSQEEHA